MRQVDVIIPTRNRKEKLYRCINSIPRKANGVKVNVVVVCDADPSTARALTTHDRVDRVVLVKEHSGSV